MADRNRLRVRRAVAVVASLALTPIGIVGAHTPAGATDQATNARRPPAATPGYLTGPNDGDALQIALGYVRGQAGALGLVVADLDHVIVTDHYRSDDTGTTHVYLRQQVRGIEVADGNISVNVARDGSVMNVDSSFVGNAAEAVNRATPTVTPSEAVVDGAEAVDLAAPKSLTVIKRDKASPARETVFEGGSLSQDPIPTKLVYVQKGDTLRLAWATRINDRGGEFWGDVTTDALTGDKLAEGDYVDHAESASHNVFAAPKRSPYAGARSVVVDPADPTASPYGWNDTNGSAGAEDTRTIGNNVLAATDIDANNVADPGSSPDGGAALNFDFPVDLTQDPTTYRPFAVENLYYWNNHIHDVLYHYGFDEAAGNFQENDYGRGGTGGDPVDADAQDGSGTDNANFGTPPDGQRPRMQMFLWSARATLTITAPAGTAGDFTLYTAANSASYAAPGLTGVIQQVVDTSGDLSDGCQPFVGFVPGRIALVHNTGVCSTATKYPNAIAAGAIGMIVGNQTGPAAPIGATIPVAGTDEADYQTLFSGTSGATQTLSGSMVQNPRHDSSLDAEVIVHEYGHGVSNRLTGGPATVTCLNNAEQMGEGWSDFVALALTQPDGTTRRRGIGAYSDGQTPTGGVGIRPTVYTDTMTVNPSTYDTIKTSSVPHGVGYVWATMLWDLYLRLIDDHGYNPDLLATTTGGNNLALALVIDGMKLQPCHPGFVDGRDAILLADIARTGGANQCAIWQAFARRGLGASAAQGASTSVSDGTQAFDVPSGACTSEKPDLAVTGSMPATGAINTPFGASFTVTNHGDAAAANAKLALNPSSGLEVTATSPSIGSCTTTSCSFGTLAIGASATVNVTVTPIAGGSQSLTGTASLAGVDADTGDNALQLDTTISGSRDLEVTASAPGPFTALTTGTVNLAVENVGTVAVPGATLTLTPGPDLDISAVTTDLGSCVTTGTGAGCSLGSVGFGVTVHLEVTVMALSGQPAALTASVSPTATDTTPANNQVIATITPGRAVASSDHRSTDQCAIVDVATVDCPLAVSAAGSVETLGAFVRLNHTFDRDLELRLVAPDNTVVLLADNRGFNGDNYGTGPNPCAATTAPTVFVDAAARPISANTTALSAPHVGGFRPEAALSTMSGKTLAGTWKLRVTDTEAGDTGTVLCWGIRNFTQAPILYTGDTTVQYSDPVTVSAWIAGPTDGSAGDAVDLGYGTDSAIATRDGVGSTVSTSVTITQPAGNVDATATYPGHGSDSVPAEITKEDCTIAYTGDTTVTAGAYTTLAAQFGELDASPGDWSQRLIAFDVDGSIYGGSTNASGSVSMGVAIAPGVHTVTASFAGDDSYEPCAATPTQLTVVDPDADLDVSLSAPAPANATVGNEVAVTATVTNHGPVAATKATAGASLRANEVIEQASPSQGTCTIVAGLHGFSCDLGTITPGAHVTIDLLVTPIGRPDVCLTACAPPPTAGPVSPAAGITVTAVSDAPDTDGAQDTAVWTITGDDCTQVGTLGTDTLTGTGADDVLCGLSGADTLNAYFGSDQLRGGRGADTLRPSAANDLIDGGTDLDTVVYRAATGSVTIDLAAGTATGATGTDALLRVENVIGSNYADTITGTDGPNVLKGLGGNDVIDAAGGSDALWPGKDSDTVNGGAGTDRVNFGDVTSGGVTVNLALAGPQNTVNAGTDTLTGIEDAIGTSYADTITGSGGRNVLRGGKGPDQMKGGPGNDKLYGEAGNDTLDGEGGTDLIDGGTEVDRCTGETLNACEVIVPAARSYR